MRGLTELSACGVRTAGVLAIAGLGVLCACSGGGAGNAGPLLPPNVIGASGSGSFAGFGGGLSPPFAGQGAGAGAGLAGAGGSLVPFAGNGATAGLTGSAGLGGPLAGSGGGLAGFTGTAGLGLAGNAGGTAGGVSMPPVCAGVYVEATHSPVDLYVMLDRSGSMDTAIGNESSTTKWEAVTAALRSFVSDPRSIGVGVGLQYFPHPDSGQRCEAASYASPAVPIGELPFNTNPLVVSLGSVNPSGSTPMGPALTGATQQVAHRLRLHPERTAVAVLVTDGEPTSCSPTELSGLQAIATQALQSIPSARTFVIGVYASDEVMAQADMRALAASGGGQALIAVVGQDLTAQFLQSLQAIRGAALQSCEFQIPPSNMPNRPLDYLKVNVVSTNSFGQQTMPYVANPLNCLGAPNGWYYDIDPMLGGIPARIIICDPGCAALRMNQGTASVSIQVGCATLGPQ